MCVPRQNFKQISFVIEKNVEMEMVRRQRPVPMHLHPHRIAPDHHRHQDVEAYQTLRLEGILEHRDLILLLHTNAPSIHRHCCIHINI